MDGSDPTPRSAGALPKYVQIAEGLIREIAAGRLADGAKLAPEREMAEARGIAVGTLRKALGVLEEQGLLERVQGSGNYIRARSVVTSVYSFLRIEKIGGGGLPTAEVLSVDRMAKPKDAPDFGPDAQAFRFRRLRFMDGDPAALEEIWLDGAQAEEVDRDAVSESLYLYYAQSLGLTITSAEDRVSVGQVPAWADPRFGPAPGDTVGYIERIGKGLDGARVEFSRTWFDPARITYISRLGKT